MFVPLINWVSMYRYFDPIKRSSQLTEVSSTRSSYMWEPVAILLIILKWIPLYLSYDNIWTHGNDN